jgi:hypothetical protein
MNYDNRSDKTSAGAIQMARGFNLQAHPLLPSLRVEARAI